MEQAINFLNWANIINTERYKRAICISLLLLFGVLMPGLVLADEIGGYDSEKLIGITSAADSNLVIGMGGVANSYLDIAMGGSHFHEVDPAFQIVSLAPLLYVLMIIFVLLGLFLHMSLMNILIGVIAIYVGTALLGGMQTIITNLLR